MPHKSAREIDAVLADLPLEDRVIALAANRIMRYPAGLKGHPRTCYYQHRNGEVSERAGAHCDRGNHARQRRRYRAAIGACVKSWAGSSLMVARVYLGLFIGGLFGVLRRTVLPLWFSGQNLGSLA